MSSNPTVEELKNFTDSLPKDNEEVVSNNRQRKKNMTLEEKICYYKDLEKKTKKELKDKRNSFYKIFGKYSYSILNEYSEKDTVSIKEIKDKIISSMNKLDKKSVEEYIKKSKTGK